MSKKESFVGGNVSVGVRRTVCQPVRGSERMAWNYDDDKCGGGLFETEKHVLFDCILN